MHESVIAVWRNRVAGLPCDDMLWDPKTGTRFPVGKPGNRKKWLRRKELFNAMEGWAEVRGRPQRLKVLFEPESGEFLFPEMYRQNAELRKIRLGLERAERKKRIDARHLHLHSHVVQDSGERACVPPDALIVPFAVRMAP